MQPGERVQNSYKCNLKKSLDNKDHLDTLTKVISRSIETAKSMAYLKTAHAASMDLLKGHGGRQSTAMGTEIIFGPNFESQSRWQAPDQGD